MQVRRFPLLLLLLTLWIPSAVHAAPAATTSAQTEDQFDQDFEADFADDFSDEAEKVLISDPLEGYNRGMFWFNDKLYFYLLKPVARGYRVVPRPVRQSVGNFFSNLSSPVSIVNSVLQLRFKKAGRGFTRLFVNTIIGVGGLFDPAEKWGKLPAEKEDFGQSLGHYGVGSGPYFVLPLLGPSSIRDTGGLFVDTIFDPMTYISRSLTFGEYAAIRGGEVVNRLSLDDDSYEKIKRDSLDPYLFMRAAYAQYRLAKIKE